MRWEDERYVRVYTRDTTDWLGLSFDAQSLFLLLLRKVDRAGLLPLGKHGKRGVAIAVGHSSQWSRLEPALEELLADGCVRMAADGGLVIPNFLAAQEARASDKARQQKARELARDTASVTPRDDASQDVTENHTPSHAVTGGHDASRGVTPSRAEPCLAVPSRAGDLPPSAVASAASGQGELLPDVSPTPPAKPAKKAKEAKKPDAPTDPRHAPLIASLTAEGWPFDGGKDAAHVKGLLALADQQEATRGELAGLEILRRARIAWSQFPSFHSARTLSGLRSKWGEFATRENGGGAQVPDGLRPSAPNSCAACGAPGQGGSVGDPEVWLGYECGCLPAFTEAQSRGLHFTKAAEWAATRKRAA